MTDKTKEFIKKAVSVHGDKYDYSKVEYITAKTKVIIICKIHDEFEQTPSDHLNDRGCNKCGVLKRNDKSRYTSEIFIEKAEEIHKKLYDYSKVNYIDSKTKVIIICKEHGEFLQAPNKHLQNHRCPKCMCRGKRNNEEFIEKAKEIHGDKYDYSKVNYINSQTKVIIICKEHGEFSQVPNSHLQNNGCIKCGSEKTKKKITSTTEEFIETAKKIHGNKYDYSKVEYKKAIEKVIIICKEHGDFEQTPSDHLTSKYGCYNCSISIRGDTKINKCKQKFIEESIKIHGDKYDYSKSIYTGCENKLIIICKTHGEFQQQPNNHLYGKGCKKCGNSKANDNKRSNTEDFIKSSKKIHGELYDYSKVEYTNYHNKVKIICREHGEFEQSPSGHLDGKGCCKCGKIKTTNSKYSNTNEFIEKSKKIYGNKFDYSKTEYKKSDENVIIICKEHGEFNIRPNNHIHSNQGCPKCQTKKQYSKAQIQWLNFIQSKDNIIIQHAENDCEFKIPNTNFKADGYCKETNTIYEFHGSYWHGDPKLFNSNDYNKTTNCTFGKLYENTLNKEQILKDMGFNLITIWESDWIRLNKCVKILQQKYKKFIVHNGPQTVEGKCNDEIIKLIKSEINIEL